MPKIRLYSANGYCFLQMDPNGVYRYLIVCYYSKCKMFIDDDCYYSECRMFWPIEIQKTEVDGFQTI